MAPAAWPPPVARRAGAGGQLRNGSGTRHASEKLVNGGGSNYLVAQHDNS